MYLRSRSYFSALAILVPSAIPATSVSPIPSTHLPYYPELAQNGCTLDQSSTPFKSFIIIRSSLKGLYSKRKSRTGRAVLVVLKKIYP